MGLAVGVISGMFGIGGGFLMTPLLIFIGITPAVAVASVASHIAASSFSGAISYWRRRAIDPALAALLLTGGTIGTALGVWTFTQLRALGQLDLLIATSYVILLTTVGGLMFWEGLRALLRARRGGAATVRRPGSHGWIHGLPLKMRFERSKIYLSVIPVVVIGLIIGFIGAVMGIGGGFILVPLMIYVLRVPTSTVVGTSMVLTLVTMVFATLLHAVTNHLVDAVLALILMIGGVTGAQFGARADMVTRRKERKFGIWINTDSRQFLKVPTYLALFSNRPFDAIASPEVQRRQGLGLNNVLLTQRVGPDYADVVPNDAFRSAFVRLRSEYKLYREATSAVTFLTPTLFRTGIPLPAEVPIGTYNVDIKLFADGQLVTRTDTAFEIVKVGFEQYVANTAKQNGLAYGLVTAMMALMTGWMASIVFRKD